MCVCVSIIRERLDSRGIGNWHPKLEAIHPVDLTSRMLGLHSVSAYRPSSPPPGVLSRTGTVVISVSDLGTNTGDLSDITNEIASYDFLTRLPHDHWFVPK